MKHVFLSYAHDDYDVASTLAQLFERQGLEVWWDREVVPGADIHATIDQQLRSASAVVVLWSGSSVSSPWVRGEAETGLLNNKLIPIKIEDCNPPINFRHINTPEIYRSRYGLYELAEMISQQLGQETVQQASADADRLVFAFGRNEIDDFLASMDEADTITSFAPRVEPEYESPKNFVPRRNLVSCIFVRMPLGLFGAVLAYSVLSDMLPRPILRFEDHAKLVIGITLTFACVGDLAEWIYLRLQKPFQ